MGVWACVRACELEACPVTVVALVTYSLSIVQTGIMTLSSEYEL